MPNKRPKDDLLRFRAPKSVRDRLLVISKSRGMGEGLSELLRVALMEFMEEQEDKHRAKTTAESPPPTRAQRRA